MGVRRGHGYRQKSTVQEDRGQGQFRWEERQTRPSTGTGIVPREGWVGGRAWQQGPWGGLQRPEGVCLR